MPNQNDIRQAITNQIISALERGYVPPWRRPWRLGKNAGAPANVVSKRSYRGLNPILLSLHAEKHQLTSKWYGTFNQWRQLDGRVMRRPPHVPEGQWGCQICFWTPVTKTVQTQEGDEEEDRFFRVAKLTGDTVAPTSRERRPGHGGSAAASAAPWPRLQLRSQLLPALHIARTQHQALPPAGAASPSPRLTSLSPS